VLFHCALSLCSLNILQDAVIEKQAGTLQEIKDAVIEAWWAIPQAMIQNVIGGVLGKIDKCVEREGGRTNVR
jgi:hypothetical protein